MLENLRELYKYRGLISALVVRHLSMRYRGSFLGFLWSFLNPLCLMLVYTIVFQYYIRFNQIPNYTIFLFCGLLPWLWFQSGLLEGTASIVSSGHLITKSMFPPHVLPAVSSITTMINFVLSLPLLFIFMIAAGIELHLTLLLLPIVLCGQLLFLYGLSLCFGALNVYFRDVQHILANFLSFLFFLCPILYSPDTVPEKFRFTLDLNPVAMLTMFYHKLILEGAVPPLHVVATFGVFVFASFFIGDAVFRRYRESFAELL